ncbi:MAG: cyclic nucleotide-binding domain-containing protein [Rhodospirillales bacterium]|nr:cyclic nucleotide-binding domain-containing protein [Rhodospirillales bacterium]
MSIADELQILEFKAGERIISQGEQSEKTYMVLSGKVRVFMEDGTKIVELATLGEDEIFGESAIFNGEAYGANVAALENCELYVITKDSLNDMLKSTDPIIRALIQMLIARLNATNEALLKSETREFIDVALI